MKKLIKKSIYVLYLIIATFVLLEIGIRIWGYSEVYIYDPIYIPFSATEDIPFIHKPNLVNARARGGSVLSTDGLGLRSTRNNLSYPVVSEQEYRIAVCGNSVTFGQGIQNTNDTFCNVLEDILNQRQSYRKVKVFNYGVSAYSVKEMFATLQHRIFEIEPDLIFMAMIQADLDTNRTPGVDKWGYTDNQKQSGIMSKDSYIKRLLRNVRLIYLLRNLRNHSVNQNIEQSDYSLFDSYKYISQFKTVAKAADLPYAIILLPSHHNTRMEDLIHKLNQDEIIYLDLTYLYDEFTVEEFKASKFDWHPSVIVHRRIGELLARYILQEKQIKSPSEYKQFMSSTVLGAEISRD